MPGSAIDDAQAAGYSDAEINAYLAPRMAEGLAAGYSQDEINQHLGITKPPPFDEQAEADRIRQQFGAQAKPVTSFTDALQAGWQIGDSALSTQGPPTKVLSENAPMYSRIAANLATVAGDLPFYGAGFLIGGGAGAVATAETGPGAVIGAGVGAMGAAMALPTALRGLLMDSYKNGTFTNFPDFWARMAPVMIDTAKSWITGEATGAAGKFIEAGGPFAVPAAVSAAKTAAEIATMTQVGAALEGHVASARDYTDAAIMLGGLKFAEMGAEKLRAVYRETGIAPQQVVADAQADPTIRQDLASDKPVPDAYAAPDMPTMTIRPGAGKAAVAPPRVPFTPDFPDVVVQQPFGSPAHYLDHPDYAAAKAGDPEAAERFVRDTIDPAKLDALHGLIGDSKPIVVAVHGEETTGRNAIPETYAKVLSDTLGLPVDSDIIQANRPGRTGQNAEYRMSVRSKFDGPVQPGRDYLIVDDNVTQGGTLADLRSYIESRGGRVVAASTLTGSRGSETLAPRAATLPALRRRFPDLESRWQGTFGHDFNGLTEGEARYLLRSKGSDSRGDRIIARAQEGTAPPIRRSPSGEEGYGGEDDDDDGLGPPPGPASGPSGPDGAQRESAADTGGRTRASDGWQGGPIGGPPAEPGTPGVTAYATQPKEPKRLIQFLRESTRTGNDIHATVIPGGLRDVGGDVASIIGGPKGRPGLINNASGRHLDDATLHAWENGYFPEHDQRPDINHLLDAIGEDHTGNAQYSIHDQDAAEAYRYAQAHNAEIDRIASETGIEPKGRTRDQFFDAVADHASTEEQARVYREIDRAHADAYARFEKRAKAWVAFHGTPHDFDAFDTGEIGTGEGAQAYGHGLYFAENEGVAGGYAQRLTQANDPSADPSAPINSIWRKYADKHGSVNIGGIDFPAPKFLVQHAQWSPRFRHEIPAELADAVNQQLRTGNLLTVRIYAKPEEMLDWDKPFSEQSPQVKAALAKVFDPADLEGSNKAFGHRLDALGYNYFGESGVGPKMSAALRDAGIKGVRYLDAASRGDGEGTHNVVVFDHNDVEITTATANLSPKVTCLQR
ncbi:MAG: hypothetical protein ABSC06_20525 [Rhodopila sp.]